MSETITPVRAEEVGLDDSWDTSKGLPDNLDFWITDQAFTTDANYNNGQTTVLKLEGQDSEGNPQEPILLSCGEDWYAEKGGEEAVHPKGKTKFNDRSSVGEFIERLKTFHGCVNVLRGRGLKSTQAASYAGLGLHLKREDRSFTDRRTGEKRESSRLLPVAFLGVLGEEAPALGEEAPAKAALAKTSKTPAKTQAAKAAPVKEEAPAANGRATAGFQGVSETLMKKLTLIAKKAGDREAFEAEAMNIEEVMSHDSLIDGLADGSLWDAVQP